MKKVEVYEKIRRAYFIEGLSIRDTSRRYHYSRRLVRKAIIRPKPDSYKLKQPRKAPVIGPQNTNQLKDSLRALDISLDINVQLRLEEIWPGPGVEAPDAYVHWGQPR